jgi:hypothetical protein
MTCPLCVQWRCATCKSDGWPDCCDWLSEAEPYWPDGTVAEVDQEKTCDSCAEMIRQYEEDHRGDPT